MSAATPRLLVLAALLLTGCRGKSGPVPAPDFALKDLKGSVVRLSDLRGKILVLDFWATWCEPCKQSIPVFESFSRKYPGKDVEVVGISEDAYAEDVVPFVKAHKMSYRVLLDPDNAVQESYRIYGLPSTVIVDRKGMIRESWAGFSESTEREIARSVESLMSESR